NGPVRPRQRRAGQPLDAQLVQPGRRAGHVYQRIDRADLVEVHVLDRDAVHPRLGFGQRGDDSPRPLADGLGQPRSLDNGVEVGGVAQRLRARRVDGDVRGAQAVLADAPRLDGDAGYPQRIDGGLQALQRPPGVQQRAEQHVAADAGEAVKVGGAWHGYSFSLGRLFRRRIRLSRRWAAAAAPSPLSMLTTVSRLAQLLSIPSRAASPPKLAP